MTAVIPSCEDHIAFNETEINHGRRSFVFVLGAEWTAVGLSIG